MSLGPSYSHNTIQDIRMTLRWESQYIGRSLYEYTLDETAYITMTGNDVDSYFSVPHDFRLVSVELKQVTAAGADSAAALSYSVEKRNRNTKLWATKASDAAGASTFQAHFGDSWEMSACDMLLTLNGVSTNLIYPVLTLMYIKNEPEKKAGRQ